MVLIYDCIEECNKCYGHCRSTTSGYFKIHCLLQQMLKIHIRFLSESDSWTLLLMNSLQQIFNNLWAILMSTSFLCFLLAAILTSVRALCTSPLVLIFQLRPFQYQICPFYFYMFVDPLPATSTLGATLLGATLGAGEVAALTGQVQTITQILAVVQQDPVLVVHLVLLDTEENSNLHSFITSLNTVKPWYSQYTYNKFTLIDTLAGKSLSFHLLKIWTISWLNIITNYV